MADHWWPWRIRAIGIERNERAIVLVEVITTGTVGEGSLIPIELPVADLIDLERFRFVFEDEELFGLARPRHAKQATAKAQRTHEAVLYRLTNGRLGRNWPKGKTHNPIRNVIH